jgi:hypothetical protein
MKIRIGAAVAVTIALVFGIAASQDVTVGILKWPATETLKWPGR